MPVEELSVSSRLEEARKSTWLQQTVAATRLGISRGKYVSYESGIVALPASVGDDFCRTFGFSQLWLATGELPKRIYLPFEPGSYRFSPGESFYTAVMGGFADRSRQYYFELARRLHTEISQLDAIDHSLTSAPRLPLGIWRGVSNSAASLVTRYAEGMPPELYGSLLDAIVDALRLFEQRNLPAIIRYEGKLDQIDPDGGFAHKLRARTNRPLPTKTTPGLTSPKN